MYHVEGETNAELAALRGDTSKQLANNQEYEGEVERFKQSNSRFLVEIDEL